LLANPRPIRGDSSWSTPIEPLLVSSKESNTSCRDLSSSSVKSRTSSLPCFFNHFL
jgi:hypothetical protein